METSNIVIHTFHQGGPIMWPLLIVALAAVFIVFERAFWWARERTRRQPAKLIKVYDELQKGDVAAASTIARSSKDPVLRTIWHGLNHHHTSLQNAIQVAAGMELERGGRFLSALDTIVTVAPLLGLLGTVTGIMGAFNFVGNEDLAAVKVSGGIAEALIATALGLTIAIFSLIPLNIFTRRVNKLQFDLQTAATNVEILLNSQTSTHEESASDEYSVAHSA